MSARHTLLAATACLALTSCDPDETAPAAPANIERVEAALGENVTLTSGQDLSLTLESNPTTGYFWSYTLTGDTDALTELSADYIADPAPEGIVGSGGRQVFRFEAGTAGKTQLTFSYQRSPQDVAETGKIRVTVTAP